MFTINTLEGVVEVGVSDGAYYIAVENKGFDTESGSTLSMDQLRELRDAISELLKEG